MHTAVAAFVRFDARYAQVKKEGGKWEGFHPVLSILSYLLKAPAVPPGAPVVNALFAQRQVR